MLRYTAIDVLLLFLLREHAEDAREQCDDEAHGSSGAKGDEDELHVALQHIRLSENAVEGKHCEQRNGELSYHKNARHGAELVVEREIVDKEVGEPHHVVPPREHHGEECHAKDCPLEPPLHYHAANEEQHEDESPHIHRTVGHRLVAEVLRELCKILVVFGRNLSGGVKLGSFRCLSKGEQVVLTFGRQNCCSALHIRHEQGESFGLAIAPSGDIVLVETSGRGFCRAGSNLGVSATHCFLAVFVGVIEVGRVGSHSQQCSSEKRCCGNAPLLHGLGVVCFFKICKSDEGDDEAEVVAHLNVVGCKLHHGKESREGATEEVSPAIAQNHSGDCRRHVGECEEFPDVSGADEDYIIGGESPCNGTE